MDVLHLIKVITAYKLTPFAKQLKTTTKPLHDQIEAHPFIKKFIDGKLTDKEYAVYLSNLLPVYRVVEDNLLYLTSILARVRHIETDLNNYASFLNLDLKKYNVNSFWLDNLKQIDELKLAAIFYTRWLGDMYGGQILAKNVKFNSSLKFKNIRKCIRIARELIEYYGQKNYNKFLAYVSEAYTNNYDLATKIQNLNL